jgi:hypothetical protein
LEDLGAFLDALSHEAVYSLELNWRDDRADVDALVERIADAKLLHPHSHLL